jgi:hypothetical protein
MVCSIIVSAEARPLRYLSSQIQAVFQSSTARIVYVLLIALNLYFVIPAAMGAYAKAPNPSTKEQRLYLLLYLKDRTSPLHEEIVDFIGATTEYLVVRLSDRVPHPKQGFGPTTLPADERPDSFSVQLYPPMLVKRDEIHAIVPSVDPYIMIDTVKRVISTLPLATQPVFRIGREGPGVKVWTEYPGPTTKPGPSPKP